MTLGQALQEAMAAGLERLDTQLLLLHALGRPPADRAWLISHDDDALPAEQAAAYRALCDSRCAGEPAAYLVGEKEFHGLALQVDRRVLVPRPDTETLVDWALEVLEARPAPRILDLGTGSGAIALALAHRRPDAMVEAVDASDEALAVARGNAARLGLPVTFRHGDWFAGCQGRYDLVVSNPPYVAEGDPHLPALRHEPLQALVAGPDGLADLRRIVGDAPAFVAPSGWLLLEHGWDQAGAVRELLAGAGFTDLVSRHDLPGVARCSGGRWLEHR